MARASAWLRCCTKRTAVTSSSQELFEGVKLSAMTALTATTAMSTSCSQGLRNEADYPLALRY